MLLDIKHFIWQTFFLYQIGKFFFRPVCFRHKQLICQCFFGNDVLRILVYHVQIKSLLFLCQINQVDFYIWQTFFYLYQIGKFFFTHKYLIYQCFSGTKLGRKLLYFCQIKGGKISEGIFNMAHAQKTEPHHLRLKYLGLVIFFEDGDKFKTSSDIFHL